MHGTIGSALNEFGNKMKSISVQSYKSRQSYTKTFYFDTNKKMKLSQKVFRTSSPQQAITGNESSESNVQNS